MKLKVPIGFLNRMPAQKNVFAGSKINFLTLAPTGNLIKTLSHQQAICDHQFTNKNKMIKHEECLFGHLRRFPCNLHNTNVNKNNTLFDPFHRNMLEKLTRVLKLKQKLTLDPSSNDFFEMDRFSVSKIEVTGRQSSILQVLVTVTSK